MVSKMIRVAEDAADASVRHILAKRHVHLLEAFGVSNVLMAFDYDGTLASLAADPRKARMRATTRRLLTLVARRYPCAVISGRARGDLARLMRGVPVRHLTGNHGLEPWAERPRYRALVRAWIRELAPRLATEPGVLIENKTYSITVHYRHARRPRRALAAILPAIHALRDTKLIAGIHAMSVVPRDAPTKRVALERTLELLRCERAIFVGDDETDEDVFALAGDRLLTIRIGLTRGSRAHYRLRDQSEIDEFLRTLLGCRPTARPRRGALANYSPVSTG
jgi:trehalose 6-phosphate phosphatase